MSRYIDKQKLIDDLEWEIGVIISHYKESKLPAETAIEIYSKCILLNVADGCGLFYYIDDFIQCVKTGSYIDYDGGGVALDKDGNEMSHIRCDVNYLKKMKEQGCVYIAWYNR